MMEKKEPYQVGQYDMGAIFDEIQKCIDGRERQPGEFTTREYAEHHGRTAPWARRVLLKALDSGIISSRQASVKGHITTLYRKADAGSGEEDAQES